MKESTVRHRHPHSLNHHKPTSHRLKDGRPVITIVGVGGAGSNAVNNMISSQLEGVEFVVANTDCQALSRSLASRKVTLGNELTRGLGAGAKPTLGIATMSRLYYFC
jgi:cell division protein FtsZ